MTYEPRWDIDREFGEGGERTVRAILGLREDQIEVKTKRRLDDGFYVETAQRPRGATDYRASGINTSAAAYWAYVIRDTRVVVLLPAERLRVAAFDAPKVEERDGDNPTRGRLVTFSQLIRPPQARAA